MHENYWSGRVLMISVRPGIRRWTRAVVTQTIPGGRLESDNHVDRRGASRYLGGEDRHCREKRARLPPIPDGHFLKREAKSRSVSLIASRSGAKCASR